MLSFHHMCFLYLMIFYYILKRLHVKVKKRSYLCECNKDWIRNAQVRQFASICVLFKCVIFKVVILHTKGILLLKVELSKFQFSIKYLTTKKHFTRQMPLKNWRICVLIINTWFLKSSTCLESIHLPGLLKQEPACSFP